ncbi:MAG TPA: L-histidine N(alpha)-methyltransferase [Actinopolymorphaceae bacterium]
MSPTPTAHQVSCYVTDHDLVKNLAHDVEYGLCQQPKVLPPKYFYDARGSELFEEITKLPEYYLTRAEEAILVRYADEIVGMAGTDTLLELGSGSSTKTRLLLDALRATGRLRHYIPVDVSESALTAAMRRLGKDYPELFMHGIVADYERHLHLLPQIGSRLIAFLGSTIGNLEPHQRAQFLAALRAGMRDGDRLLLGTDLVKSPARLLEAYDDAAGITAEFNRNVLYVLNRRLGADFVPSAFEHVAMWNLHQEWVEMRLRSTCQQQVRIDALGLTVTFHTGEQLRTEVSAKFRPESVARELAEAGFSVQAWWTDPRNDFALTLAAPA